MQDRYFGDIGDFAKFGLLRALLAHPEPKLRLGVLWYLVPDESHNADGRHISYLDPTPENRKRFRSCDPELYDTLQGAVAKGSRRVALALELRLLPDDTAYYSCPLSFHRIRLRERGAVRAAWLRAAYEAVATCGLLFADPDNGLQVRTGPITKRGPKYAFYSDLQPLVQAGKSLIVYQHVAREGTVHKQAIRRLREISQELSIPLSRARVLLFRRISVRFFFVISAPQDQGLLRVRLRRFLWGPWGEHFQEIRDL